MAKLSQKQADNLNKALDDKAREILMEAKKNGVKDNYCFITTFMRYMQQIEILRELEAQLKKDKIVVSKEYVKGRKNLYTHPAVAEYNKTSDSANKTVKTLLDMINKVPKTAESTEDDKDALFEALGIDE